MVVTDYILGFENNSNQVILKKYSVDHISIKKAEDGYQLAKNDNTIILTDGEKKDMAFLWHYNSTEPKNFDFCLVDRDDHILADNFNVKTGIFFIKFIYVEPKNKKQLCYSISGIYDAANKFKLKNPICYDSMIWDEKHKKKDLTMLKCFESFYTAMKGKTTHEQEQ